MGKFYKKMRPFILIIFMQFAFAVMYVFSKVALNHGMSNYVYVVYRHAIAAIVMAPFAFFFDKTTRPNMTLPIFLKVVLLSLLMPVIDDNLYFLGMKYTSATFATALNNILPGLTFIMACIFRIEKVKVDSINSQAKIIGTITTFAGAMIMTLVKGPVFELHKGRERNGDTKNGDISLENSIKGALMILVGCFSTAGFVILQAITLKTYPAALSLTVWICALGAFEATIVALVMERGNYSVWSLKLDTRLLTILYSGTICSLAYYVVGMVSKYRGPVFVTAFTPLGMVIVAIMSFFILFEQLSLGRICGAIVIVGGLYLVIWGKRKDYVSTSPLTNKITNNDNIITINGSDEAKMIPNKQECSKGGHKKDEISREQIIIIDESVEGTMINGKNQTTA